MRKLTTATLLSFLFFLFFVGFWKALILSSISFAVVLIWEIKAGRITIALTKRVKAKKTLNSVIVDYYLLKMTNPAMDEHWYLANTWIRRYQLRSRADRVYRLLPNATIADIRARDPMHLQTFAYIESHQFSVLSSPQSIGAFADYILYKEMPDQAELYASEYAQLMQPVLESQRKHTFLTQYKQKNSKTYQSIMAQSEVESELRRFFMGVELEDTNPELAKKLHDPIDEQKKRTAQ
jgi:hypothetical protein